VLHRKELSIRAVEAFQGSIERGRLAAAGWSGDQDDAVGLFHEITERHNMFFMKAELLEIELDARAVEDAQVDALTEDGRDRRYPKSDVYSAHRNLDGTVLGQTALGDVEPRHDLDPRGHGSAQIRDQRLCRAQGTVDAVTHQDRVDVGLDVNVRCAQFDGIE